MPLIYILTNNLAAPGNLEMDITAEWGVDAAWIAAIPGEVKHVATWIQTEIAYPGGDT